MRAIWGASGTRACEMRNATACLFFFSTGTDEASRRAERGKMRAKKAREADRWRGGMRYSYNREGGGSALERHVKRQAGKKGSQTSTARMSQRSTRAPRNT